MSGLSLIGVVRVFLLISGGGGVPGADPKIVKFYIVSE
jgi:hypothetical protein